MKEGEKLYNGFKSEIKQFDFSRPVLLAVSGGADSVCMADLFFKKRIPFAIAHVNFMLRGQDSFTDEIFVRKLALRYQVPCFIKRVNLIAYAKASALSTQMAARDLRYLWFRNLIQQEGFSYLATAHHGDDQIETVLMNWVRGTGLPGIRGMIAKRDNIIRPLLSFSRNEIESYIIENQLVYRKDLSNDDTVYQRNFMRKEVIPALKKINPALVSTVKRNSRLLRESEILLEYELEQRLKSIVRSTNYGFTVKTDALLDSKTPFLILYHLLRQYAFHERQLEDILDVIDKGKTGTEFYTGNAKLTVDRKLLFIEKLEKQDKQLSYTVNNFEEQFECGKYRFELCLISAEAFENRTDKQAEYFDADTLQLPFLLRSRKDGDRYRPLGMQGFKRVKKLMTDTKISRHEKDLIPLWFDQKGNLFWVSTFPPAHLHRVREQSQKILCISWEEL